MHPAGTRTRAVSRPRPRRRGGAEPGVPPALALAAAWCWRLLVVGAVVWFVTGFLSGLSLVTVPLVLAFLLAALLRRPALLLRRTLPRGLAGLVTVLAALAVLGAVFWFVQYRVRGQIGTLTAQAGDILGRLHDQVSSLPGIGSGSGTLVDRVDAWVQQHSATLLSGAFTAGQVAVDAVTGLVLTLFLTLFFLIDGERIWAWTVRLLPPDARPAVNGAGYRAFSVLSGWITGTAVIATIHGVVIGLALWLLGTPMVAVLAVLVFIGSFIPIIGAFVFGGLACLVTLVTVGLRGALILLAVLIAENLLEGHVYQPLIMGRTVKLHPVAILLAIAAGSVLDGVVGAIIAIPLAGSVSAAVKYLRGIEDLHGNPLGEEDRMAPEPPPLALVRGQPAEPPAAA